MSNPLQQLKDKQLQEFDRWWPSRIELTKHGVRSNAIDRIQIKSFLTSSIELAYEEGKKEKAMTEPTKEPHIHVYDDDGDCLHGCGEVSPPERVDSTVWNERSKELYLESNKPPEKIDDWEKEFDQISDDYQNDRLPILKTKIKKLIISHRQDILEEIRGKVEGLKGKWKDDGLMANRGNLWEMLIDDLLKELK